MIDDSISRPSPATQSHCVTHITIQEARFNNAELEAQLRNSHRSIGALVTFTGIVREFDETDSDNPLQSLFLEHYPSMTEQTLKDIVQQAGQRWPLQGVTLVHRVGELACQEPIVFVGVASKHRQAAFESCEFIMDFLKTKAPFWKREIRLKTQGWVQAKEKDVLQQQRWQDSKNT